MMALALNILLPVAVSAQATTTRPPLSLTTSPIPLNVVTQPGETVTADLRVKNNNTSTEKLKIELLKFGANGETGNPQLREREAKDTYFEWVSFSEDTFTAEPGVWKTIKMTIKTPPSAAFGYYLAVLFSRATPDKPTGGSSAVEGGVASLVLLDVNAPGSKREASVISLTADRKVYEFLPANFKIKLRNNGNVHVAPAGSIFIKRGDKQIALIDFNTQRGNILPASTRAFEATWNDGFPYYDVKTSGTKTTKELKWDFGQIQKLRIGHYTATLVAVYDDGQRDIPIEATVGFWIIPWRILGVLLLILLLVGAGLWMILRSIWKKIRRRPSDTGGSAPTAAAMSPEPALVAKEDERTVSDGVDMPVQHASADDTQTAPKLSSVRHTDNLETIVPAADGTPKTAPEVRPNQPSKSSGIPPAEASDQRKTAPELKD